MRLDTRVRRLWDQSHALANARAASTELSRLRVEREEVEIYLERRLGPAAAPVQRAGVR